MNKDLAYVMHIRDAILLLEEYTNNLPMEEFESRSMVKNATVYQIQIIGEATKKLSVEFTNLYPQIPWSEIARMRDRIVHHYFDIDTKIVWDIVKYDINQVKEVVLDYINKQNPDDQLKAKLERE